MNLQIDNQIPQSHDVTPLGQIRKQRQVPARSKHNHIYTLLGNRLRELKIGKLKYARQLARVIHQGLHAGLKVLVERQLVEQCHQHVKQRLFVEGECNHETCHDE